MLCINVHLPCGFYARIEYTGEETQNKFSLRYGDDTVFTVDYYTASDMLYIIWSWFTAHVNLRSEWYQRRYRHLIMTRLGEFGNPLMRFSSPDPKIEWSSKYFDIRHICSALHGLFLSYRIQNGVSVMFSYGKELYENYNDDVRFAVCHASQNAWSLLKTKSYASSLKDLCIYHQKDFYYRDLPLEIPKSNFFC